MWYRFRDFDLFSVYTCSYKLNLLNCIYYPAVCFASGLWITYSCRKNSKADNTSQKGHFLSIASLFRFRQNFSMQNISIPICRMSLFFPSLFACRTYTFTSTNTSLLPYFGPIIFIEITAFISAFRTAWITNSTIIFTITY